MGLFDKKDVERFGEIAVEKGYITQEQLDGALAEQKDLKEKSGIHKKIGVILMEKGLIQTNQLNAVLREQYLRR